jgi:type I site-specific restriction endonuclease
MGVPEKIIRLVERFDENLDAYKQGRYNETQVRREFIDPLFQSLGWDVDSHKQLAEAQMPQAQTLLQRQIDATDRQIDRLVYELYGLTEDEIKIVESGTM